MCTRRIKLIDLAADGGHVRLWFSGAVDTTNDSLWHPASLHQEIIEHAGSHTTAAMYGAFDPKLAKMLQVAAYEDYCAWQSRALNYLANTGRYDVIYSHIHNVDALGHKFWHHAKQGALCRKMLPEQKLIRN